MFFWKWQLLARANAPEHGQRTDGTNAIYRDKDQERNDEECTDRAEMGVETGGRLGSHHRHGGAAATPPSATVVWIDLATAGECHWALAAHKEGCCQGVMGSQPSYGRSDDH